MSIEIYWMSSTPLTMSPAEMSPDQPGWFPWKRAHPGRSKETALSRPARPCKKTRAVQSRILGVFLFYLPGALWGTIQVGETRSAIASEAKTPWHTMVHQADALGLPTRFLRVIPPSFVTQEFEDLHTFAAEYHQIEHRMVLNRSLSFNVAGGVLKPLAQLTHRELSTLYHELFHAYMDYIASLPEVAASDPDVARLLAFARDQQQCRYQAVMISPVLQRKLIIEPRYLTDHEAWEALNETWAVFVGWAVWTSLELPGPRRPQGQQATMEGEGWIARLKQADRDGSLVGYYEPQEPKEREITHKRYLAPSQRISPREVAMLLEVLFGILPEKAKRAASVMEQSREPVGGSVPCRD